MKDAAARIIAIQLVIGIGGAVAWGWFDGIPAALAALGGALISALLTFYTAVKVFARGKEADPRQIVAAMYRAEAMKLLLAAVLLSVAISQFPEYALPLVSAFAASLAAYWFALLGSVRN